MSTNIKVCVRVRPENGRERAVAQNPVVGVVDESLLVFDPVYDAAVTYFHGKAVKDPTTKKPRDAKFAFDRVFGPSATNIEVYEQTTKCVLRSLVDGYNCSVFAYGATGAGKTFSMLGSPKTPGVIFLSMMDLYNIKESERDERSIDVSVSYLEVYNENIKDLLSPGKDNLPIREDGKQGVIVSGLTVREPNSAEELLQMLEKGNKNRTQHPTDANAESSRSHAVFQVFVRIRSATANLSEEVKTSKLSLIDLAGSERATVTKNRGARFREGANINKSLLALGNCINALADTKRKGNKHVPYRNSKLTRILKDSLGENCKTVMLAAVSPSRQSYEDTYNTLSYADRAKKIKAVLKKNVMTINTRVQNYGKVVGDLQGEIAKLKEQLRLQTMAPVSLTTFDIDQLQTDISKAYGERRQIRDDIIHVETMQNQTNFATMRREQMLKRLNMFSVTHAAGYKTVGKVKRAINSANSRQKNLENSKKEREEMLEENTSRLRDLTAAGLNVDNPHAQEILSLQMKAYHFEQESREREKVNHHLTKLLNTMHEEKRKNERIVEMFVEYLETSESMLRNHGLQTAGIAEMYTNIKGYITNEKHVQFNGEKDTESEKFASLIHIPVMTANESSLQITDKALWSSADPMSANDTITLEDANGTFTVPSVISPATSPTCSSASSTTSALSPTRTAPSPTTSALSPTTSALSPTMSALSPTMSALSPTTSALSPTMSALSPTSTSQKTCEELDDATVTSTASSPVATEKSQTTKVDSLPVVRSTNAEYTDIPHDNPPSVTSPPKDTTIRNRRYSYSPPPPPCPPSPDDDAADTTYICAQELAPVPDQPPYTSVHEVLKLTKGSGCQEIEEKEEMPDCPPAKVRVIARCSRSPTTTREPPDTAISSTRVYTAFREAALKFQSDLVKSLHMKEMESSNEELEASNMSGRTTPQTMERISDTSTCSPGHINDTTVILSTHDINYQIAPREPAAETFADIGLSNNTQKQQHESPPCQVDNGSPIVTDKAINTTPGPNNSTQLTPTTTSVSRQATSAPLVNINNKPASSSSTPGYLKMTTASASKRLTADRSMHKENDVSKKEHGKHHVRLYD